MLPEFGFELPGFGFELPEFALQRRFARQFKRFEEGPAMSDETLPQSEFILYQTEDGRTRIQCRFEDETLWLTQAHIAELFHTTPQNVTLHVKAIFAEGELSEVATCKDWLHVQIGGSRELMLRSFWA